MPNSPKSKESWITSVKGNELNVGIKKFVFVEVTEFNIGDAVRVTVEEVD